MLGGENLPLSDNFKRGTIEILLLTLLCEGDKYGYQLAIELESRSEGDYTLKESALYPPLYRMAQKGWITSRDQPVNGRNRVYYHLEPEGKKQLSQLRRDYLSLTKGALRILGVDRLEVWNDETE